MGESRKIYVLTGFGGKPIGASESLQRIAGMAHRMNVKGGQVLQFDNMACWPVPGFTPLNARALATAWHQQYTTGRGSLMDHYREALGATT